MNPSGNQSVRVKIEDLNRSDVKADEPLGAKVDELSESAATSSGEPVPSVSELGGHMSPRIVSIIHSWRPLSGALPDWKHHGNYCRTQRPYGHGTKGCSRDCDEGRFRRA
ncbi:hypothetical protein GCM10008097_24980 [Mycetocola manganoxydans]|nr:hypothetical protein GCM10008097_24980 [Mycetocola manganoxydans]